jgi:branched-chain amino acid transport system ATP-binding protein
VDPLLDVRGLMAGYKRGEPVVRNVSLTLSRGEVVGLLGPNGAGKSTVLRALAGVCAHIEGEARLDGGDLLHVPPSQRVRMGLSFVPRDAAIFPNLTVRENLSMGAYLQSAGRVQESLADVLRLLPQLSPLLGRRAAELSGGQAEMVAIGLGLMSDPKVLMVDEPSAGLSGAAVQTIVDALAAVVRSRAIPLLLVEQNLGVAEQLCSRFCVLESGGRVVGEVERFDEAVRLLESTIHGSFGGVG